MKLRGRGPGAMWVSSTDARARVETRSGGCLVLSRNSKDSTVAELGARGRWEVMDEVGEMTEDQSGGDLAVNYTDFDCYLE